MSAVISRRGEFLHVLSGSEGEGSTCAERVGLLLSVIVLHDEH